MYATNSEMMKVLEADNRVTEEEKEAYTQYVRDAVQKGLEDIENGRFSTHEEVMREMRKWLEE